MIKDILHIYENVDALSEGFTSFLKNEILVDKEKTSISLSGGSTPKALFDYWSKYYSNKLPWNKIEFFWGDERCVAPDDEMSNYGMTKKHLFDHIDIPDNNIYRMYGENNPSEEVARYSQILNDHLVSKNKIPCFDLIILGLGDDGHTASIFPNQIELWDSKSNCVVAHHPDSQMERVSITGQIIENAQNVAFLVTGLGKAQKAKEIIKNREQFKNTYPAARVLPRAGQIHWFLDKEAASLL